MSNYKTGDCMDCTMAAKPSSKKARHPYATVTAVFYVGDMDFPSRAVADRIVNAPRLLDAAEARLAEVEAERDGLQARVDSDQALMRAVTEISAECWQPDSEDPVIRVRSRVVGTVLRNMVQSCIQAGGANNLTISMGPGQDDSDLAGYRWEVHVVRPNGKSPTEQRQEVEAERDRLRAEVAEASQVLAAARAWYERGAAQADEQAHLPALARMMVDALTLETVNAEQARMQLDNGDDVDAATRRYLGEALGIADPDDTPPSLSDFYDAVVEARMERDQLREALAGQEAIVADLARELATVEMVLDDPDNACVEEGEVAERVMELREALARWGRWCHSPDGMGGELFEAAVDGTPADCFPRRADR